MPIMMATEFRRDKYLDYLRSLLTDEAPKASSDDAKPRATATQRPARTQRSAMSGAAAHAGAPGSKDVLTLAGREPVTRAAKTAGSKVLRLESVASLSHV